MQFNESLIDLQYTLIRIFLINFDTNILDISYDFEGKNLSIQIVLLDGCSVQEETKDDLAKKLPNFKISIKEIEISKQRFNENRGEWQPKSYHWMKYLLFSKAEVL